MKLPYAVSLLVSISLLLTAVITPTPAAAKTEVSSKAVDAIFSQFSGNIPGCSVGVEHKEQTIFAKGYGKANLDYNIANTIHTRFRIASATKQFTAAAVALLADDFTDIDQTITQ